MTRCARGLARMGEKSSFRFKRAVGPYKGINAPNCLRMNEKLMPTNSLSELAETFALLDDWEDRYRVIVEMGQKLAPLDPGLKTDAHLVRGCTSRVWLVAHKDGAHWQFLADSDAVIVRGLIAILLMAYQGRTSDEILAVDIEKEFAALGLESHLSPSRRNGFFAMVERVRGLAGRA